LNGGNGKVLWPGLQLGASISVLNLGGLLNVVVRDMHVKILRGAHDIICRIDSMLFSHGPGNVSCRLFAPRVQRARLGMVRSGSLVWQRLRNSYLDIFEELMVHFKSLCEFEMLIGGMGKMSESLHQ
jgi:hypothetical protein